MRQIDDGGLLSCRFVADLFEHSVRKAEGSSKAFVRAFAYSSVAKRVSSPSFIFDSLDVGEAYNIIKSEKKINKGKDVYPTYVMAWIGYIYEYFVQISGLPAIILNKKVKTEELFTLYEPYHSLDNEMAVKRICESKGIRLDFNDAELLKRCR